MIYLEEFTADPFGTYLTRWWCKPPAKGTNFIVKRERWDEDDVRDIFEITLVTNTQGHSR